MAKEQKKEENLEEKQDVRQLRHSFRMAIAGLLLLVLVATGTTYAGSHCLEGHRRMSLRWEGQLVKGRHLF